MRVLVDTFPLGAEVYDPTYKTGVYRVVEQLARRLAAEAHNPTGNVETVFYSARLPFAAWCHYRRHLRGRGTRFALPLCQMAGAWYTESAAHFARRTLDNRHPALRLFRWSVMRGSQRLTDASARLSSGTFRGVDICHSSFFRMPSALEQHPKIRRFTTVYDLIPITHPQYFGQPIVDALQSTLRHFRTEDFAVCISQTTRALLLTHAPQLQAERVFVVPLGAGTWCHPEPDPKRIASVAARYKLPPGAPYFLSLCTLEPRKNLETIIRAFARLRAAGEISAEHRLLLVGSSGWKTEKMLRALDEANGCRDAILLTGFVPDEYLPALYSGALAFVYVSRLEGFGLPPLEAMQCGAPVITANTSSLPEVVGDAGLTIDPDDVDSLCAHMRSLSQDADLRRRLSAQSLERARGFSWERFGDEMLAAYRQAMAMN
jgi:glycosyltransferase involved in cell wall biosynthesis